MTSKIFRSAALLAVVVLLCTVAVILGLLYGYFDSDQKTQLEKELELACVGTQQQGIEYLRCVPSDSFRLTWVDLEGKVLYDTRADENGMESHADREEILEALETGTGDSVRYSDTLMEKTVYRAKKLPDGTVLRISVSSATTAALLFGLLVPVCVLILAAILLAVALSHRIARRIVQPLNRLDLEQPLQNDTYEEIAPLLQRINQQHLQITAQMKTLQQKTDEFNQITRNLQDGLVLLDKDGLILSINPAAQQLFGAEDTCVGKDIVYVDGSMRAGVNRAFLEGDARFDDSRMGRDYRFSVNRIRSDGRTVGAVILIFDVTEQLRAEKTRREFTANVSHELKTPLQSIMGSAELMENGLVKPEDMPAFTSRIRREAERLLNLIQDIIRLSQLDEGAGFPREAVDMPALAGEVAALLQPEADRGQVLLTVESKPCTVYGVRRLLHEILYNLCENAIKYNVEQGSVLIRVFPQAEEVVLQVSDTGIGIPPEHQDRIFERFYRVDKSHSRASGGTGLGLSIVKHGAMYHSAKLELSSVPGEGTTITVRFPDTGTDFT